MDSGIVKFLIIRFSSIGDIVLTSPVIRCLKEQVDGAEIHFLTKPSYKEIVSYNPYIDKVHTLRSFRETVNSLKDEGFDYIIDLHKNLRTYRFKNSLKVMDFSFPKLNLKKWLLVNFKINKLPDVHIVDRYFSAVKVFDVKNDNKGLDFFITDSDFDTGENVRKELDSSKFVCFCIGGNHYTKKLPTEKITEICKNINYPVVLIGGKEDIYDGDTIKNECTNVYNYCGKLSISESAAVIEKSSLIITHDTGMMHIAAALKKDIISVWGNTVKEFGMFPYLPGNKSVIIENNDLSCRPCSKIGYKKCPKKHFKCMKDINDKLIYGRANEIIQNA